MTAVNQATLDLIKRWEGFEAEAYWDKTGQVWTIGYGTTENAGVGIVPRPGIVITEKQAEDYLRKAVEKFADTIRPHIKNPNENEFGAFVSLAYNVGPGAVIKSTALKRFNSGDKQGAAEALKWFNKSGGIVLKGLVNRRNSEAALMLTPVKSQPKDKTNFLTALVELIAKLIRSFSTR